LIRGKGKKGKKQDKTSFRRGGKESPTIQKGTILSRIQFGARKVQGGWEREGTRIAGRVDK